MTRSRLLRLRRRRMAERSYDHQAELGRIAQWLQDHGCRTTHGGSGERTGAPPWRGAAGLP